MTIKVLKNKEEEQTRIELINLDGDDGEPPPDLADLGYLKKDINKTKESLKHSKGLFIITLVFLSTLFPFASVVIIEEFYELHMLFHAYSFLFLRICSVFNPIFYGLFNSSFMFGYKNVLNIIFHCEKLKFKKKKTEPRKKIVIVYRRRKNVDVV